MDMLVVQPAKLPKPDERPAALQANLPPVRIAHPNNQPARTLLQSIPQPSKTELPEPGYEKSLPRAKAVYKKRSRLQLVLVTMAILVFGIGLLVNLQTLQTNNDAKAQAAALSHPTVSSTNDSSSTVPSEARPSGIGNYVVAPNMPKYIKIPKLGVNARVRPLDVTSNNDLQTPNNIYDTGWYDASARPGDPGSIGAMLLDGHVHGPTLPGVFYNIKNLHSGDVIQIVRGDNQVFLYHVVKVQNYDAKTMDMGRLLASVQPGKPGLNLITCGGPFNRSSGEYTQRTVVFAVQA